MSRIVAWAAAQITFRNLARALGLCASAWILFTNEHPDPIRVTFCLALMGLAEAKLERIGGAGGGQG